MQESGVYPMERHVPEFQAWNGCGDSKEHTAARRHGIDITKPLEQGSGHPRPKEAAICNINRAEPGEAAKSESRIGGVECESKSEGSVAVYSTATFYFCFLRSRNRKAALYRGTPAMEKSGI
jgi:hypothetical protein